VAKFVAYFFLYILNTNNIKFMHSIWDQPIIPNVHYSEGPLFELGLGL